MGPGSIIGIMSHFTIIFAPKLITLFFKLRRQKAVDIQNQLLCGYIYPGSTAESGDIETDDVTIFFLFFFYYNQFFFLITYNNNIIYTTNTTYNTNINYSTYITYLHHLQYTYLHHLQY